MSGKGSVHELNAINRIGNADICGMRVFISRALYTDAPFRQILESEGFQVTGIPLVELMPLPFEEIPVSDWVFFSSKNAVVFFFEQITLLQSLGSVKWAAIGPATAKVLETYVPTVDFTGTGDPEETARLFQEKARGQSVVFPAARHSRAGVQRFLTSEVQCVHVPIYDNRPLPCPEPRTEDVLVFTSPMGVAAYCSQQVVQAEQVVVAIGQSTFEALQTHAIKRLYKAAATTEEAMAAAVLAYLPEDKR